MAEKLTINSQLLKVMCDRSETFRKAMAELAGLMADGGHGRITIVVHQGAPSHYEITRQGK
jgi:hypothetical protein